MKQKSKKNPVGAPRSTSPSKEELIKLGKDLVEWASEKTDEKRTSFSFWYAIKHDFIQEEWKLFKQKEEFRPYYEKARALLANKIHSDELEKGMAHRYIRLYDRDLAEEEDADKDADIQRKVNAAKSLGDRAKSQLDLFLEKEKK